MRKKTDKLHKQLSAAFPEESGKQPFLWSEKLENALQALPDNRQTEQAYKRQKRGGRIPLRLALSFACIALVTAGVLVPYLLTGNTAGNGRSPASEGYESAADADSKNDAASPEDAGSSGGYGWENLEARLQEYIAGDRTENEETGAAAFSVLYAASYDLREAGGSADLKEFFGGEVRLFRARLLLTENGGGTRTKYVLILSAAQSVTLFGDDAETYAQAPDGSGFALSYKKAVYDRNSGLLSYYENGVLKGRYGAIRTGGQEGG